MSSDQFSANLLLLSLSAEARASFAPHLTRVDLPLRHPLHQQGDTSNHVYFLETALASSVARSGKEQVEVGIAGREGISSTSPLLGGATSPFECFVQVEGEALRIEVERLSEVVAQNEEVRRVLLRYAETCMAQIAHTALANARFTILERAARWLLMCHDRVPGDRLDITHEFLALMLGVRRAGVTTEIHVLEGEGAIRNRRGRVIVRDRRILEDIAGASYGEPEALYERSIGQALRRSPSTAAQADS